MCKWPLCLTAKVTIDGGETDQCLLEQTLQYYYFFLQVYMFLKAVLKYLVPMALWGSAQNRQLFFKYVKKFVSLRRFETLSVQELMQGYKVDSRHLTDVFVKIFKFVCILAFML